MVDLAKLAKKEIYGIAEMVTMESGGGDKVGKRMNAPSLTAHQACEAQHIVEFANSEKSQCHVLNTSTMKWEGVIDQEPLARRSPQLTSNLAKSNVITERIEGQSTQERPTKVEAPLVLTLEKELPARTEDAPHLVDGARGIRNKAQGASAAIDNVKVAVGIWQALKIADGKRRSF